MLALMDWPRLDTSSWNLTLGVAATATSLLVACGPFVIPEGETDTDAETDTDPSPTDPSETDTTPAPQCNDAGDCQPGYECIGGVCMPYDYYCNDGGCCYGGTGGCCYDECCYGDCYENQCYSDAECGYQGLCEGYYGYYGCQFPLALPDCDTVPEVLPLELPLVGEGDFVSMSFVEANGDSASDIVVGRSGTAELHWGANAAPPVLLPVPVGAGVVDAVSGDFDSDGDLDIVASTDQGSLILLAGDGAGSFALTQESPVGWPLLQLSAVSWDGGQTLDVAGISAEGDAWILLNDGTGAFSGRGTLPTNGWVNSLTQTIFSADSYDDLAVQDQESGQLYFGNFSGDLDVDAYLPGAYHGQRWLHSADISQSTSMDLVGITPMAGWVLLELWGNGIDSPQRFAFSGDDVLAGTGDVDGDGVDDVVTAGSSSITYVRGNGEDYPTLECRSTYYFLGAPTSAIETGDFDGNGRADVAIVNGGSPLLLLTQ